MFKIFIAITLALSFFTLSAQDVLIDKKGNELPCQLVGSDKKNFSYKGFQDPEFTTMRTPISRYRKIKYADGREVKISPPPSGWLSFTLGPAVPISSYASSSADNQYSGFAKTGTGFQIEGAFPLFGKRKQWSIVGIVGGFSNKTDIQGKLAWYQSSNKQSNVSGYYNGGNDHDKNYDWRMGTALIGLGYTIPISWKFSIDQKITAGVGHVRKGVEQYGYSALDLSGTTYIQYHYSAYGNIKNGSLTRAESTTAAFCYGLAVRFNLTRSLALKAGADFQYASPTFKVHQSLTPDPPSGQAFDPSRTEHIHSTISVVRINVGICLNLIPKNIDYGIPQ